MAQTAISFEYTKDDGEVTPRRLYPVGSVPAQNLRALDLTAFGVEDEAKIVEAYGKWEKEVKKPFDKRIRELTKAELKTFETYLKETTGIEVETAVKSFKEAGLRRID